MHEDSDYSLDASMINNITEYKAATYPVSNYWKGGSTSGVKPANSVGGTHTTKPNSSYNTSYYNNTKSQLISKIHEYSNSYSLSSLKIQALFGAFLDFFEEEVISKDTKYANDLDDMQDILSNLLVQVDSSFHLIEDQFADVLKNESIADTQDGVDPIEEAMSRDVPTDEYDYSTHSYTPNFNN